MTNRVMINRAFSYVARNSVHQSIVTRIKSSENTVPTPYQLCYLSLTEV